MTFQGPVLLFWHTDFRFLLLLGGHKFATEQTHCCLTLVIYQGPVLSFGTQTSGSCCSLVVTHFATEQIHSCLNSGDLPGTCAFVLAHRSQIPVEVNGLPTKFFLTQDWMYTNIITNKSISCLRDFLQKVIDEYISDKLIICFNKIFFCKFWALCK